MMNWDRFLLLLLMYFKDGDKMALINIINENTITFTRINKKECLGYNIYVSSENMKEVLLTHIKNVKTNVGILERKNLEYNEDKVWDLPHDIIGKSSMDIKFYINHVEISSNNFYYNDIKHSITLLKDNILESDNIEIEYRVD